MIDLVHSMEHLKASTRAKLDASKLVLNSSWHFTGSQVHLIGIPQKGDLVLDPLRRAHFTAHPLDQPGREGLVAGLTLLLHVTSDGFGAPSVSVIDLVHSVDID